MHLDLMLENELFDLNRAYRASSDEGERKSIGARMLAVHRELLELSASTSGE